MTNRSLCRVGDPPLRRTQYVLCPLIGGVSVHVQWSQSCITALISLRSPIFLLTFKVCLLLFVQWLYMFRQLVFRSPISWIKFQEPFILHLLWVWTSVE